MSEIIWCGLIAGGGRVIFYEWRGGGKPRLDDILENKD